MRRWLLAALLLVPCTASATTGVLRICDLGDTQTGTECTNATTAWDHLEGAVNDIVSNPSLCDVVMWPGDMVTGRDWSKDCWCASQADPAPDDCTIYTNPYTGDTCSATDCNDPEAQACDGGTAGWWCEFTRVRNLMDALEAAGVPSVMCAGNHEWDNGNGLLEARCVAQWTDYNTYFGANRQSALFDEVGSYQSTYTCPTAPTGVSVQPDSHYYVLTAGGAQWLFIGISWSTLWNGSEIEYYGMSAGLLAWVKSVLDAHLGMPTIVFAHTMITTACADATLTTPYEDAWCPNLGSDSWKNTWTGMTVYDQLLNQYPQIFLTVGGHIRTNAWDVTENTTYPVAGMAFDYTNPIAGAPGWQIYLNGGGGVIQTIRVDAVAGQISTFGYSPLEEERVGLFGDEPSSHYEIMMPMCKNKVRFNFAVDACPEREPSPQCCFQ